VAPLNEVSVLDHKVQLQTFLAHLKAGRKQEANDVLREVLTSNPSKAGPYALLVGGMLVQNGQFREAVPIYQEAIRVNPGDPNAYYYLGVAYHALKEEGECERIWDELEVRFPEHATTYCQRALRALKLNQFAEAKAYLNRAIELIEPDNPMRDDALKTLAVVERELKH